MFLIAVLEVTLMVSSVDTTVCIDGFEQGQAERDRGALLAGRAHLVACASEACPASIRKECRRLLDDLAPRIPTVVFRARDEAGRPVGDVRVRVEGIAEPIATDASPIELDPGPRVLVWERGGRSLRREIVEVALGERGRVITAVLSEEPAVALAPPPAVTQETRRVGSVPWLLGGLGVAGIGTFVALAWSVQSDLEGYERCKPACDRPAVEDTRQRAMIANVALGLGVASFATALWWVLHAGAADEPAVSVTTLPLGDGGGVHITGTF